MDVARGFGRLLSAVAVSAAILFVPGPAAADRLGPVLADCQMALSLDEAVGASDLVFVGTVTALANGGRGALVQVEEVWRGGEMPATVTVLGGTDPGQAMEDDRTFEAGVRYVFFPLLLDGAMVDNICTATTPWLEEYAVIRPADAHDPIPATGGADPGPFSALADLAPPILTALLIGGAALTLAIVVGRRRDA